MQTGTTNTKRALTFLLQAGILCGLATATVGCSKAKVEPDPKEVEQKRLEAEQLKQAEEKKRKAAETEKAQAAAAEEKRIKDIADLETKIAELLKEKAPLEKILNESGTAHRAMKAEVWTRDSLFKELQEAAKDAGRRQQAAAKKKADSAQKALDELKAKFKAAGDQLAADQKKMDELDAKLKEAEKALSELKGEVEKKSTDEGENKE